MCPVPFSDHCAIATKICVKPVPTALPSQRLYRNFKRMDLASLRMDISCANLCELRGSCDDMWQQWLTKVVPILDAHAPLRHASSRPRQHSPWVNEHLFLLIRRRNHAHRKWLQSKCQTDYDAFKEARRIVTRMNRELKTNFFQSKFTSVQGNPRKTWKVLNELSGRQRVQSVPQCSASNIGCVFADVVSDQQRAPELCLPQGPVGPKGFTSFSSVSIGCVRKLLGSLDTSKATGSDGIPAFLLKSCADLLAPSLTLIFNASLAVGSVPDGMKLAHVTPVFKAGNPQDPGNYRPVSLLPIVSKLLERIVHRQLSSFLDKENLYPPCQFGFRRQHSTEDALVFVTDTFVRARDAGQITGAVLVDMSKAFDKVRHQVLINDLFELGISGSALVWFADYLSNRRQIVHIAENYSPPFPCMCGVPQGSVLGPLLFVLYVRSIQSIVSEFCVKVIQFADDILLYVCGTQKNALSNSLSAAVSAISTWLSNRNLILNARKTQVLFLSTPHITDHQFAVYCHGVQLKQVTCAKYLGIHLDQDLSWSTQVDSMVSKLASKIGILFRNRHNIPLTCRETFVKCLVLPDFLYASNCFSAGLSLTQLGRLERMLKRALRSVYDTGFCSPSSPLFARLGLDRLATMYCKKLLYLTWRCLEGRCSVTLSQMFERLNNGLATRSLVSRTLKLPMLRTAFARHGASFQCAKLWNDLHPLARCVDNSARFKKLLPQCLAFSR